MPTKIEHATKFRLIDRLNDFRLTIPNDVGYSAEELSVMPCINASSAQIRRMLGRHKMSIIHWDGVRMTQMLVNQATLKKHANKPKK